MQWDGNKSTRFTGLLGGLSQLIPQNSTCHAYHCQEAAPGQGQVPVLRDECLRSSISPFLSFLS